MCGETTEADSVHADISSIFTSGKNAWRENVPDAPDK